ncbi:MAG: hypothetical protein ABI679_13950, partial [Gemmatimonadota bacterium]
MSQPQGDSRSATWLWVGGSLALLTTVGLARRDLLPWLLGLDGLWLLGWLFSTFLGFFPIPSTRWFVVAASLSLVAIGGFVLPDMLVWLLLIDALWLALLVVDAFRIVDPAQIDVRREAPPAFSVGRALPVQYTWTNRGARSVRLQALEEFPEPLGGAQVVPRLIRIPGAGRAREQLSVTPTLRGKGHGGRLDLRILGPMGLAWRQTRTMLPWDVTVYPSLIGASIR